MPVTSLNLIGNYFIYPTKAATDVLFKAWTGNFLKKFSLLSKDKSTGERSEKFVLGGSVCSLFELVLPDRVYFYAE